EKPHAPPSKASLKRARSTAIACPLRELPQPTKPQPCLLDHDGDQRASQPNGYERGARRKTHIELRQFGE
ncbi:hypothetical protein, partial [Stenotrophomonas maltophilia group sp. Smal13]|uniref:hypothetical protein n=1 Tax=Stenotrophomonas maltophilia group sp. Smal13 TaxID=3377166 RepID=UPI0025525974